jgi:hypothetical protein
VAVLCTVAAVAVVLADADAADVCDAAVPGVSAQEQSSAEETASASAPIKSFFISKTPLL